MREAHDEHACAQAGKSQGHDTFIASRIEPSSRKRTRHEHGNGIRHEEEARSTCKPYFGRVRIDIGDKGAIREIAHRDGHRHGQRTHFDEIRQAELVRFRELAGIARLLGYPGLFRSGSRFRRIHAMRHLGRPSCLRHFRTLPATGQNNTERGNVTHSDHAEAREEKHIEVARVRERRAHQRTKRRAERDRKHVITHALAFAGKRNSAAHDRRDRCL